ncbi:MAG: hypothetical protein KGI02_04995 [Thaumarchaeota archaeon]|nr:hypothetical protein [Nitrososphaerota archaeon]
MLFGRIPISTWQEIAAKLNINFNLISAKVEVTLEKKWIEETRYSKLKMAVNYIEKYCEVGTVAKPKEYFKGTLLMYWGPWLNEAVQNGKPTMVFFSGEQNNTHVGLCGSMPNVIGEIGRSYACAHSTAPGFLSEFGNAIDLPDASMIRIDQENWDPVNWDKTRWDPEKEDHLLACMLVASDLQKGRGPVQHLEFLAKRLRHGPVQVYGGAVLPVLFGSPIYVARAN